MPKGISVDEREKELEILKGGVGKLEKRIDKIEKELISLQHAFEKVGDHVKGLHEAAATLIKKVHEFE